MSTVPSADAKAVVRAIEGLSTQLRRAVDAYLTPVVQVAEASDDAPPTAVAADREPSYAAVYAYIRQLGDVMPTSRIDRNAIIWHAVNAALEAMPKATTPATTCSARYTGALLVGDCIRAAGHLPATDHTDASGRHYGDNLAEYPVNPGVVREAPAADEAAPNMLRVLADRAARGVLSEAEGESLRRRVEQLINGRETWKGKAEDIEQDRDRIARQRDHLEELLRAETARANAAIDREEAAEQDAEEQRRRARIFETELRVLRAGLRANGADPTQIQNLWAQIRLRNGQWRDAKRERDEAQAAIERVRHLVTGAAQTTAAGISDHDIGRYDMAVAVLAALDGTEQPTTEGS